MVSGSIVYFLLLNTLPFLFFGLEKGSRCDVLQLEIAEGKDFDRAFYSNFLAV